MLGRKTKKNRMFRSDDLLCISRFCPYSTFWFEIALFFVETTPVLTLMTAGGRSGKHSADITAIFVKKLRANLWFKILTLLLNIL